MPAQYGELLAKIPLQADRRQRRRWVGNGRAYIEVKGLDRPGSEYIGRHVEAALSRLEGVHWAQVNAVAGRVVVAFDGDQVDVDDLVELVGGVEEACGVGGDWFPGDRPDHPGDVEPMRRQVYAIGADIAGFGLGLVGRLLRVNPLIGETASLISLVDATPALRRRLEARIGRAAADIGLAVGNAIGQGLVQGPLGLVVDVVHRGLVLDELRARKNLWHEREPLLHGVPAKPQVPVPPPAPPPDGRVPAAGPAGAPSAERPAPLPSGPVESYSDKAAAAALAAAAATALTTRDPRLVVAASLAANPKPARFGREGFAARLDRDLARSGVLAMDAGALRRLDRVDTVLLDSSVLTTGRMVAGSVWLPPERAADAESALLAAHALVSHASGVDHEGALLAEQAGWALTPVPRDAPSTDPVARRSRDRRSRGRRLLALWRHRELLGLVDVEPELDPMAGPLVAAARSAGTVAIAGRAEVAARIRADQVVPGGASIAASVRALQADGAVVALVSAGQRGALAAADLGIGVLAGPMARTPMARAPMAQRPPWGADVIVSELGEACRVLRAIPAAKATSRRAATFAAYGSGVGAVLALAGPRRGAATRALLGVNGAALASLGGGIWSATTLARQPPPLPATTTDWHALEVDAVLARLGSSRAGLTRAEAEKRRAPAGRPAELAEGDSQPGLVRASIEELANPLTPALSGGAGLAAASGSITDAALIGTFMLANAVAGGIQRVGVTRALARLIDASAVRVRVLRDGGEEPTTAERLVIGDVIIVQAGDMMPADCRIIDARGLEADESSLTGESQLVTKVARPSAAANIADRHSMLYAGSAIAAGTGSAVVVALGPATELGRGERVASQDQRRPGGVQARLARLTKISVPAVLGAGAAVIGSGLLRGQPMRDTLGTGVSLAVAAVPESLPIVASAAQYSAARRLSRRDALVRNPGTIEALGRVDVLCFDKTGTLTQGRIRLHRVWAGGVEQPVDALTRSGRFAVRTGLRATPERGDGGSLAHATDQAVADGAAAAGVFAGLGAGAGPDADADGWRLVGELPFEPSRGYHAVLGRTPAGQRLAVKGAPEVLLPMCSNVFRSTARGYDGAVELDARARRAIERQADRLASRGYRVLAVAERCASSRRDLRADRIGSLCFAGLLALADPVRLTAAKAITGLRAAGVEVMMLTGDHPSTAQAIGAELGLLDGRRVVTGPEIDRLSDAEVDAVVGDAAVFARVSPDHKVRIVAALRRAGRVVAVTGDGANDAPAIRLADVGVALGRRGTNAAKEAADIVVTDDRIETIIDAIVEGRAMWSSVRDAIAMLLGGNLGEVAFTIGTALARPGGPVLGARQLLLVNLFTDMVPSLVLAVREPAAGTSEALLCEGPDASLGGALTRDIVLRGALTAAAGLGAWLGGRLTGVTARRASTIGLVGIVGAQLGQTLVAGWRSPPVVAASLGSAAALAGVIQTPGLSQFFGCRPLGPLGWCIGMTCAAGASLAAPLLAAGKPAVQPDGLRGRAEGEPSAGEPRGAAEARASQRRERAGEPAGAAPLSSRPGAACGGVAGSGGGRDRSGLDLWVNSPLCPVRPHARNSNVGP